jgi:predicted RNase H-like HicB family nuclease
MPKRYTVTDGKLVLHLHPAKEGGYTVTAPFVQGLVTEANTIEEAFEMAHDAYRLLQKAYLKSPAARQGRKRSA